MLPPYDDILNAMTRLTREVHYEHYRANDEGHEGAHPQCKTFSYDVLGKRDEVGTDYRCCSCVATPLWFDEHGVPRFAPHGHDHFPIYAEQVALVRISCQACEREFEVQMSWSRTGAVYDAARFRAWFSKWSGLALPSPSVAQIASTSLAAQIREERPSLHFGDPPFHTRENGLVCAGATMNCWDLKVMEFWIRTDKRPTTGWGRIRELERDLPDMTDPERLTGVPHYPCPQCKQLVADHDGFGVLAHVAPMPNACGYCTHPSAEVIGPNMSKCGICSVEFARAVKP